MLVALRPIEQLGDRLALAKADSDVAAFITLLFYGEAVLKLTTAGLVSLLDDDDGHRYRLEYGLVRADSPGAWATAIDDLTIGSAATARTREGESAFNDLTERLVADNDWRLVALRTLYAAITHVDPEMTQDVPTRSALRHWFGYFAMLRNRTRGHGSFTDAKASLAAPLLEESIQQLVNNLHLFHEIEWGYVKQQMSGRYRVVPMAGVQSPLLRAFFENTTGSYDDGVYLWAGEPRPVQLLTTDATLIDFFYPNGAYRRDRYEVLSYVTDDIRLIEAGSRRHSCPAARLRDLPTSPLSVSHCPTCLSQSKTTSIAQHWRQNLRRYCSTSATP